MSPFIFHISSPGLMRDAARVEGDALAHEHDGRQIVGWPALCSRMISFGSCSDSSATAMKMPMPSALHSARPSTSSADRSPAPALGARSAMTAGVM